MKVTLFCVFLFLLCSCQETVSFNLGRERTTNYASEEFGTWGISHACPNCFMELGIIKGRAHLQSDGTILFFGGETRDFANGTYAPIELNVETYLLDLNTKLFTKVGALNYQRRNGSTVLLDDGRVFVGLGVDNNNNLLLNAEIYDPVTRTWTEVAAPSIARQNHATIKLNDGRILVIGGNGSGGAIISSGEIFNPMTLSWEDFPYELEFPRTLASGFQTSDGRIFVMGGTVQATPYDPNSYHLFELFDPLTQSFSAHEDQSYVDFRFGLLAVTYSSAYQKAMIMTPTNFGVFDPDTFSVNLIANPGTIIDSNYSTHLKLDDERVIILGERIGPSGADFGTAAYFFDFQTNSFEAIASQIAGAAFQAIVQNTNGDVVTIGGSRRRYAHFHKGAEVYSLLNDEWRPTYITTESVGEERSVVMSDDRILVAGGIIISEIIDRSYIYDPNTRAWSMTGNMNVGRVKHSLVKIGATKYLAAGGMGSAGLNYLYWDSAEIYDAVTEEWTMVSSMSSYRDSFTMHLLDEDSVIAVGGIDFNTNSPLGIVEIYNISEDRWELAAPLNYPRAMPKVFNLSD